MLLSLFICACHPTEERKITPKEKSAPIATSNQEPSPNSREGLITAIQALTQAMAKKDKSAILSHFNFPLADSSVNFFEVDSIFDAKRVANDGAITRAMFDDSFASIYEKTEMAEFKNLVKFLKVGDLADKNDISYDHIIKDDGCYYFYGIAINSSNEVRLSYGTNSNDVYRQSHPDEEEICSEFGVAWIFKFDGKKLQFLKHQIAG